MTTVIKQRREPYQLLTGADAVMLLIDHQVGTMGWTSTIDHDLLRRNTLVLAKAATAINMPIVMTTSMEDEPQGPLFSELRSAAPEAFDNRIKRAGIVDAMDDQNFAKAVEATGRKRLIMAGATTEVCITFPAIRAARAGYDVYVVTDASAALSARAEEMSFRRMADEGVILTSTLQLIAELAKTWATEEGRTLNGILFTDIFAHIPQPKR
ncbi:TPA: isochorismatase family protein [Pseudomonas aeruginosa]